MQNASASASICDDGILRGSLVSGNAPNPDAVEYLNALFFNRIERRNLVLIDEAAPLTFVLCIPDAPPFTAEQRAAIFLQPFIFVYVLAADICGDGRTAEPDKFDLGLIGQALQNAISVLVADHDADNCDYGPAVGAWAAHVASLAKTVWAKNTPVGNIVVLVIDSASAPVGRRDEWITLLKNNRRADKAPVEYMTNGGSSTGLAPLPEMTADTRDSPPAE